MPLSNNRVLIKIWHFNIPLNLKCFIWLVLGNHISTWDTLLRKGWCGPIRCCLCFPVEETISHIFLSCTFVRNIIAQLNSSHNQDFNWSITSILGNIEVWYQNYRVSSHLPLFLIWNIWITRNHLLFEGRNIGTEHTCVKILDQMNSHPLIRKRKRERFVGHPP